MFHCAHIKYVLVCCGKDLVINTHTRVQWNMQWSLNCIEQKMEKKNVKCNSDFHTWGIMLFCVTKGEILVFSYCGSSKYVYCPQKFSIEDCKFYSLWHATLWGIITAPKNRRNKYSFIVILFLRLTAPCKIIF